MRPEKPWTRKLGPAAYLLVALVAIPAIASIVYLLILPKFNPPITEAGEETAQDISVNVDSGEDKEEPIGAFTFLEFESGDSDRIGQATLKIADVTPDGIRTESIRSLFPFFPAQTQHVIAISPDGSKVAYRTPTEIRIRRLEGTNETQVAALTETGRFAWSDDSAVFAYQHFEEAQSADVRASAISLFNPLDSSLVTTRLELNVKHDIIRVTDDKVFVRRQNIDSDDPGIFGYYERLESNALNTVFHELVVPSQEFSDFAINERANAFYYIQDISSDINVALPYEIKKIDIDTGTTITVYMTDVPLYALSVYNGSVVFTSRDGLYTVQGTENAEPNQLVGRNLLVEDTAPTHTFEPIDLSPNKDYFALVTLADGTTIDAVAFIPFEGAENAEQIHILPNEGLLPAYWEGNVGWSWVGL